jgi:hypothetical protein
MEKLNPVNTVIFSVAVIVATFYYIYAQPASKRLQATPVFGQSSESLNLEDLTVIAKMPFLTYENTSVDVSSLPVDDNLFFIPAPKFEIVEVTVEEVVVTEVVVNIEDLAPMNLGQIKPDYAAWAKSNLTLQSVTSNGVIINDRFYKVGKQITNDYLFDDGSSFVGDVVKIGRKDATLKTNDGKLVMLTIGR